jgi:DNA-binding PadR family transcriptional regulator
VFTREIKKGSMELLVLGLLEERPRHGYEIGKLIEARSGGRLTYSLPSLYPALLKLEARGLIKGRWVERPGERRRCFYRLTAEGRLVLDRQKQEWDDHVQAIRLVLGGDHA